MKLSGSFALFALVFGVSSLMLCRTISSRLPFQRISEIVAGRRSITADSDLRLCKFFGLSNGYWLRAQAAYDTELTEETLSSVLAEIEPWEEQSIKT